MIIVKSRNFSYLIEIYDDRGRIRSAQSTNDFTLRDVDTIREWWRINLIWRIKYVVDLKKVSDSLVIYFFQSLASVYFARDNWNYLCVWKSVYYLSNLRTLKLSSLIAFTSFELVPLSDTKSSKLRQLKSSSLGVSLDWKCIGTSQNLLSHLSFCFSDNEGLRALLDLEKGSPEAPLVAIRSNRKSAQN